jgi:hypothetical protein
MSGKLNADLIIETEAGRYTVELQASGEPEDVRKHFQQLDTYAQAMRAKEAWHRRAVGFACELRGRLAPVPAACDARAARPAVCDRWTTSVESTAACAVFVRRVSFLIFDVF